MIEARRLSKSFGAVTAVRDVSLSVAAGQILWPEADHIIANAQKPPIVAATSGMPIGALLKAATLASNTGWSTSANATAIAAAVSRLSAFPFPVGSADSALIATLSALGPLLPALSFAAQGVLSGFQDIVVAGGIESMSRAPHLLLGSRTGTRFGPITMEL